MNIDIIGLGTWGVGFESWSALRPLLKTGADVRPEGSHAPAPQLIPPRERRRAPLAVRLAVEVADQTCRDAGVDPAATASIFAMGNGDSSITDYLCRTLLGDDKPVSPTKFHNSVHNAASGYWSISVGCRAPANAISALQHTVPVGLLEAAVQCTTEQRPVLLVAFDVPTPAPLHQLYAIDEPFGLGLVIAPGDRYRLAVSTGPSPWPKLTAPALAQLYDTNPAARALALAAFLAGGQSAALNLPLDPSNTLTISSR